MLPAQLRSQFSAVRSNSFFGIVRSDGTLRGYNCEDDVKKNILWSLETPEDGEAIFSVDTSFVLRVYQETGQSLASFEFAGSDSSGKFEFRSIFWGGAERLVRFPVRSSSGR